ncbi:MAG: cytochrome c oxidase subunit II [Proteobacteria bacterium]|jgi:cytochrome c oxidase subunit 2|nr:cytochrome c oxidase subunit II [Pseudomonadota bacterium]
MRFLKFFSFLATLISGTSVWSQSSLENLEIVGKPWAKGIDFQPPVTELARDLQWLDNFVFYIITVITLFVVGLLLYAAFRFSAKRNPEPASFTHNSPLEVAWTLIPVVILIFIGAFSVPVLFKQQIIPAGEVVIKATGNQWYWNYEYVDHDFDFDSFMIGAGENRMSPETEAQLIAAGYSKDEFLLATDTALVIPINKAVVVQVTGADVIHAWAMPAFGVKQDGVPGRLAQLWFKAEREGIYFGQCSELCGQSHAFMPITVKVVSQEVYDKWLNGAITEYAGTPRSTKVASLD